MVSVKHVLDHTSFNQTISWFNMKVNERACLNLFLIVDYGKLAQWIVLIL